MGKEGEACLVRHLYQFASQILPLRALYLIATWTLEMKASSIWPTRFVVRNMKPLKDSMRRRKAGSS